MKPRPPRLVQARADGKPPQVKCKCRSILTVPAAGIECPCGERFQLVEGGKEVRQVVIGEQR